MATRSSSSLCRSRRVLVAAVGMAVWAGCGVSDGVSNGAAPTSTTPATSAIVESTTTTDAVTTTTTTTTTTVAVTSTTTAPPTTAAVATVPADAPVLTAFDALLTPSADPVALELGGGDPCALLTGTAGLGGCGVVEGGAERLVWFASDGDSPEPPVVVIYRVAGDALVPMLELPESVRGEVEPAHVEAAALDDQPGEELVVGVRNLGTGGFLQLDIVGGDGAVAAHVTLDQGRAIVGSGVIDTWAAQYGPDDPNCCPGSFRHEQIVFAAGQWRSVLVGDMPPAEVPAGQFP